MWWEWGWGQYGLRQGGAHVPACCEPEQDTPKAKVAKLEQPQDAMIHWIGGYDSAVATCWGGAAGWGQRLLGGGGGAGGKTGKIQCNIQCKNE